MSSDSYYLGVDVGTGSARACIVDASGEMVALATKDIKLWTPQPGHYEQSTEDIWAAVSHCVHACLSGEGRVGSGVVPTADCIRGIGFDATCSLAVLDGATDEPIAVTDPSGPREQPPEEAGGSDPVRNVILWLDHRATAETATVNATSHPLLRFVGGRMSVEMEVPKALWLKRHLSPEDWKRCRLYDLADALTHLATGNEARSFCSAVCKQGYVPVGIDGSVKGWNDEFLRAVGLEDLSEEAYKKIGGVDGVNGTFLSAGQLVGRLCAKAASDLGLPEGIPVGSGVIDAYAGWIGTVGAQVDGLASGTADDDDMLQASTRLAAVAGTSTCHLALAPGRDAVFVPGVWGPYRDVVVPGYWMAEGGQSATGELLRHVVSTHPAYEEARRLAGVSGKEGGIGAVYGYLNSRLVQLAAKRKTPGSGSSIGYLARHIFFYGDLWGNRSPVADETMRGAVVGLDSDVTVDGLAVLYYAAMEGIALQTRQIVETMNSRGHAIRSIFLSGSQALNPILVQLLANACRMPVVVPRYVAAAVVHGTTMLAVKAASEAEAREALAKARDDKGKAELGESLWSIMKRMTKPGKVVHPVPEGWEMKLLDAKYTVFLELCRTQREYRSTVDEAIKRWE